MFSIVNNKLLLFSIKICRSAGIRPVIALPYDKFGNWNTRNVMRILGKISKLDMNDITWQLGGGNCSDFMTFFF